MRQTTAADLRTRVVDLNALAGLDDIIPELAKRRVVFVGEVHDDFAHHLSQLEIIRGIHAINPNIAVGVEFFQQPFQEYLDGYIAGALDDQELLRKTEYYSRWKYDFRLYRPILHYARSHAIPMVALNVAQEIVDKVSRSGFEGLTERDREQAPAEVDRSDQQYRERLRDTFQNHPGAEEKDFARFVEVQLLWDESMAERAAQYLHDNPKRAMIVLAGNGHIAYGSGIPRRVTRRIDLESAIVVNGHYNGLGPDVADYVVLPDRRSLPPPGRLGVLLNSPADGIRVGSFSEGSAAQEAGIQTGDWIEALDGHAVSSMEDIKVAMWNKQPGDQVSVRVRRDLWLSGAKSLTFDVELR